MASSYPSLNLTLPAWIDDLAKPGTVYSTSEERMRLVIALADRNVAENTGGPFGAAIFELESGRLIAPGVNIVEASACSLAHAETMAIALAQKILGTFDLSATGMPGMELVSSAQPCIQCWGAIWWSGIRRLTTGASREQTETLTGFDEGPVPPNWAELLRNRSPKVAQIEVVENVSSEEACDVLRRYRALGRKIYNPGG